MVLVVDIGNTNIVLGMFEEDKLTFTARLATDRGKTDDEYAVLLQGISGLHGLNTEQIEGIILSSVVPPLTDVLRRAIAHFTQARLLVVGPGTKTGFTIKIDNPAQLGTDMVCNVAGALAKHSGPMIIVDMGTATTITVVDAQGSVLGGAIAPGVRISLDALSSGAAQLPHIPLRDVKNVIGKNTLDCMQSGVVFGAASMVDGMIDRISEAMGEEPYLLATGGVSGMIVRHCRHKIHHNPDLLVEGLYALYLRNTAR